MAVFVIAPDSFKGTLSSEQVIACISDEIRAMLPDAEIRAYPMADGGEGTLAVLRRAADGTRRTIVEMAETCGLTLILEAERDPRSTSTYAFGQAIRTALDAGAEEIVLALGGSSTNDCGTGALRALGARFLDGAGRELEGRGADLARVASIDLSELDPRISRVRFTALCDVDNPLLGPDGATLTFGPQKGATPEICAELEAGMASFARVLAETFGRDESTAFGAGVAGGMGLAARVFLGADVVPGAEYLLDALGFDRLLADADWCITGEGRADAQSAHGKVVARVAMRCRAAGVPCIAICGCLGEGAEALLACGVTQLAGTVEHPTPADLLHAEDNLRATVRHLLAEHLHSVHGNEYNEDRPKTCSSLEAAMTEKRVAVFVADGLEEIEGLTVVDILYRAGIPCDTVSISDSTLVTSAHNVRILCDRTITDRDFSFDGYDMLVLPGGMPGTANLRACQPLCDELIARARAARPLAAICAAPTVLAELGILSGKRACCFPGCEDALEAGGAEVRSEPVVRDGALITSRGMGTALDFALAIVAFYQGDEAAEALAKAVVKLR